MLQYSLMRVEPFSINSYVHTIKRGARGIDIFEDKSDYWRFLRILFYMNDEYLSVNWARETSEGSLTTFKPFERPPKWPTRKPIVKILCYTLVPNHIHLLLKEIRTGGISLFMKKISQS